MERMAAMHVEELTASELTQTTGASILGYAFGYCVGYVVGLIVNADPLNGNYYCLGA